MLFFSRYKSAYYVECEHVAVILSKTIRRLTSHLPVNTILHNNSISCKKKSDIQNKMYYIFGEYKVQDSELTPLYHVLGDIMADIKVCRLYVQVFILYR